MSERMEFRDWSTDAVKKLQAQEAEIDRLRAELEELERVAWEMANRAGGRDAEIERLRAEIELMKKLLADEGSDRGDNAG